MQITLGILPVALSHGRHSFKTQIANNPSAEGGEGVKQGFRHGGRDLWCTDGWHIVREGATMGKYHSSAQMAQGYFYHAARGAFLPESHLAWSIYSIHVKENHFKTAQESQHYTSCPEKCKHY